MFNTKLPFPDNDGQDNHESIRPMAASGLFYPDDKDSLVNMLSGYYQPFESSTIRDDVAAVIVPHAGYVFSGVVAASAFAQVHPDKKYDHIFLIGPSHHVYMDGASVNDQYEYCETPLGKMKVDTALCRQLIKDHPCFSCNPEAHSDEHCLEVQLPFLQYRLQMMAPVVPIVIGTQSVSVIRQVAESLKPYFNDNNLFVISSDFSHYPSYQDAQEIDECTCEALISGSPEKFLEAIHCNMAKHIPNLSTSACGQSAILTLLYMISKRTDIRINHMMYRNSGDSDYGDYLRVVGYHAFTFTRVHGIYADTTFALTCHEKETLLRIARKAIKNRLSHSSLPVCNETGLTSTLRMPCGAFVTLNDGGRLRGCIGRFGDNKPLYQVVEEMAQAAAFDDPRFYPLQSTELRSIHIEISVLSPLRKIGSPDEFVLGKQGIYISKDGRSGTFLPQVAEETNWNKEEFLGHCAHDKAGLSWNEWKEADLYTYEAFVFKEDN